MAKNLFDQQNINSFTKKQNLKLISSDSWIEGLHDAFGHSKTINYYVLSDEKLRATRGQRRFLNNKTDMKDALKVWTEKSLIPQKWQLNLIKRTFNSLESVIDLDFRQVGKLEKADMPIVITGIPNSSSVSGKNDKIRDHVLFMSHQDGLPSPYHKREVYSYKHDAETKKVWNKTLMHEVAHFLGLEHPWDKNDGDKDSVKNYTEDTTNENAPFKTLMGYNNGYGKHGTEEYIDVFESYQDRDLAALQQIWGTALTPEPQSEPYEGIIKSVRGKGELKGTDVADAFTFASLDIFNKKGADEIVRFDNSQGDTIAVSPNAFPALQGASELNFASTKNKKELKQLSKEKYDFVYFEKKGRLYFDGNGAEKNWGNSSEGGLVAILKGKPELTAEDLTLLA